MEWICIEANPKYMAGYLHRTCTFIQAAAGPIDNEKVSFSFQDALGGVVGSDFDNHDDVASKTTSHDLSTVPINTIFHDFSTPFVIDYLSLDIEGAEAWAFQTFSWDKYTFWTLTVERPKPILQEMLKSHNYVYLCDYGDFGDQLWIHPSLPGFQKMCEEYEGKGQCRS